MKPRNPEARRLQADYLTRLKSALEGGDASQIDEIVESVREHISEALAETAGLPFPAIVAHRAVEDERLSVQERYT